MPRNIQDPVVTQGDGNTVDWRATHPAFGQIVVSRTSHGGSNFLYGSDHSHHYTYTITVYQSELIRHLSNDRYHTGQQLISFEMTEDQFNGLASFVGLGEGNPCTLRWIHGQGYMPELPRPGSRVDQFRKELQQVTHQTQQNLEQVMEEIRSLPISNKKKEELVRKLSSTKHSMVESAVFVADQFDEHVSAVSERARASIARQASLAAAAEDAAKRRSGVEDLQPTAPALEAQRPSARRLTSRRPK